MNKFVHTGTYIHIYLRQLLEKYHEGQKKLHCVFIDLEKAYDRVPRKEVWNCMRMKGVPEKFIRIVQDMYQRSYTQVRTAVGTTERFEVTVGVHQGSALSPFLFAMVMDCLTEDVSAVDDAVCGWCSDLCWKTGRSGGKAGKMEESFGGPRNAHQQKENWVLVCGWERKRWCGWAEDAGWEGAKSDGIKIPGIHSAGERWQRNRGGKRIAAGWNSWRKVSGVLCDRKVPLSLKGKLHKVVVRPAVMYSMETLAVTQRMEKKLEVAEMRMLRFGCGITRLDKVKNEEVRSKLKVGQLGVKMREGRLTWLDHVVRREKRYVGRIVMAMEVGKRKRGRPKGRWKDCIREDLKAAKLEEADAQDRRKWKKMHPHQRPHLSGS